MDAYEDYIQESMDEVGELASKILKQNNFTNTKTGPNSKTSVSHNLVKDNVIGVGKKSGLGFPASASPTIIFLISVGLVLAVGFIIFLYALRKKYNMIKYKSPREMQMSQGEEAMDGDGDGEDSTLHFMRLKNSASPPLSQGYPEGRLGGALANPNANFNASSGANSNANERGEGGNVLAQDSESNLFFDHPTARGTFMKIHFQNSDSKYKILEEM